MPATLKLLTGRAPGRDSGGRPVPTPPGFERGAADPPDFLDAQGRAMWDTVVDDLEPLGLLKTSDLGVLASYCEAWSRYTHAVAAYRAEGVVQVNPTTGHERKSVHVTVAEAASLEISRLAGQLGLSPAAERVLGTASRPETDDADPFASTPADAV